MLPNRIKHIVLTTFCKVGLLDVDLCGPSIPYMIGLEDKDVYQSEAGWVPIYTDMEKRFAVMSIGFLLKSRNDAVIWRGPKKTAMIRQFLNDVQWEDLDYLIIDTPPGNYLSLKKKLFFIRINK